MLRDSAPRFVGPLVRRSVGPSARHTLLFWGFCGLWPHCSCPNDQVTSNMAPAHPQATVVAMYPALFQCSNQLFSILHISKSKMKSILPYTATFFFRSRTRYSALCCVGPSVGPSIRRSIKFLNCGRFLHYCPCSTVLNYSLKVLLPSV